MMSDLTDGPASASEGINHLRETDIGLWRLTFRDDRGLAHINSLSQVVIARGIHEGYAVGEEVLAPHIISYNSPLGEQKG